MMDESAFTRNDGESGTAWQARLEALAMVGRSEADRRQHQAAVRRAGWFAQAELTTPESQPSSTPAPAGGAKPTSLQLLQEDCRRLTAEERRQLRDWLGRQP
jgi:hypothetical protein